MTSQHHNVKIPPNIVTTICLAKRASIKDQIKTPGSQKECGRNVLHLTVFSKNLINVLTEYFLGMMMGLGKRSEEDNDNGTY